MVYMNLNMAHQSNTYSVQYCFVLGAMFQLQGKFVASLDMLLAKDAPNARNYFQEM